MKNIVLFGYGANGRQIAKKLKYGRRILVVDDTKAHIQKAVEDGFDNAKHINIQSDQALAKLRLDSDYETFICSLDDEGMNIFLVISLKDMYPSVQTVAISDSIEMNQKLSMAGADKVIDIYESSSNRIYNIFEKPYVMKVFDILFHPNSTISFKEFTIDSGSFLVGRTIDTLDFNEYGLILIGVLDRDMAQHFTFTTHGHNHRIDTDDVLVCMGRDEDLAHFENIIKETQ